MDFRADIHRLRGLSVLLVLFFHFGFTGFAGGYLGVDIFFVLSGYLITRLLIIERSETGKIGFLDFYVRRIKRLVPAALFTLLFFAIIGMYLLPARQDQILTEVTWGVFPLSNYFYVSQTGYFSPLSEEFLFLNYWSLAIEEQFYLIWPLILGGLIGLKTYWKFLFFLPLFLLGGWLWLKMPDAAFYQLQGRAWELAAGAIVAMAFKSGLTYRLKIWGYSCVALALLGAELFGQFNQFYFIALAVIGTCLILSEADRYRAPKFLGVLFFFGTISYALYLCHWPIKTLFFLRYEYPITLPIYAIIFALSVLCACFIYTCIEKPLRKGSFTRKHVLSIYAASTLSLVSLSYFSTQFMFAPEQGEGAYAAYASDRSTLTQGCFETQKKPYPGHTTCQFGQVGKPSVDVWLFGDSHADHWEPGLAELFKRNDLMGVIYAHNSAIPAVSLYQYKDSELLDAIQLWRDNLIEQIDGAPPATIILAARWSIYFETEQFLTPNKARFFSKRSHDQPLSEAVTQQSIETALVETISQLQELGHKVIIFGQVPEYGKPQLDCAQRAADQNVAPTNCGPDRADIIQRLAPAKDMLTRVANLTDTLFIDPAEYLCRPNYCALVLDGVYLYRDDDHLNAQGSIKVVESLQKELLLTIRDQ